MANRKAQDKATKKKTESPMPVPSPIVDRKVEALRRLRVKPEQLATAPSVEGLFKDSVTGGLTTVMEALRFGDNDEVIAAFLKKYDSIPSGDRDVLSWEAIAISAGINLKYFAGSAMIATANYCGNKSRIIVAMNHPDITKKRIEYALLPSGEKDRYALDLMVGAIKPDKGSVFINKAVFGGDSGGAKKKSDDGEDSSEGEGVFGMDDDLDELFPSVAETQTKLVPIRQRLLEK